MVAILYFHLTHHGERIDEQKSDRSVRIDKVHFKKAF